MLKEIEEFSEAYQEKNDTREFSLKYKLLMISLMCLFESSNQYFFYSARQVHIFVKVFMVQKNYILRHFLYNSLKGLVVSV